MIDDSDLTIDVLGTAFTVCWGPTVTPAQRQATARAWSRCLGESTCPAAQRTRPDTPGLQFTAAIHFHSKALAPGARVKHLGAESFERLAEAVTSEVTIAAILERAGELTMLHACGVADPADGAVIALVAKSGTGKTTASSQLAKTFGYVTDETVAIRADGTIEPYPKPLSMKQQTPDAAKLQVGPDELGLQATPTNLYLKTIALLDRVSGGDYQLPVVKRVPLIEAVLALIPETSSQAAVFQPLQSLCRLIESVGGVFRVSYSEAADLRESLAPLFLRELGELSKVPSGLWSPALPEKPSDDADESIPPGWLRRAPAVDAVEIEGDLLVLTDSELTRLSGIGPFIWMSTKCPISMRMLTRQLEAVHGLPEGYEAMLDAAVDALVGQGLIARGLEANPMLAPIA